MDTRKLAWSRKDIRSPGYWRALDNHNRVCERYIGKMAVVFKQGAVKESEDGSVDRKVRGFVLSQVFLVSW